MTACGLWLSRGTLWASVANDDGRLVVTSSIARNDDARWGLLESLEASQGLDVALVMTDTQARLDDIARIAVERKLVVWLAPWRLVDGLRTVAGLTTGPPRRTAILLARLPLHPGYRGLLKRLERDHRQLVLL
jgi:hypothetical protein